MTDLVKQMAHDALDRFFAAPTSEPLIIESCGVDGVVLSRGIPAARLTKVAAASFLGISRPTLDKHIKARRLRVGIDGRISRKSVLNLFSELDGRA